MKKMYLQLLFLYFCTNVQCAEKLIEFFKWKQIEYGPPEPNADQPELQFPGNHNYERELNKGMSNPWNSLDYIPYNNVPMGVMHHKGRLFITVARRNPGIPSTLNYISTSVKSSTSSPKLISYPNYEINDFKTRRSNKKSGDDRLVSVYRVKVDVCDRLWFVDTGKLEYRGNVTEIQPPSIWVIDLNTDRKIRRYEIPKDIIRSSVGLVSIAVDVNENNCDDAFAYIPDMDLRLMYVYSYRKNKMWKFVHNYFSFDPLQGDLNIGGQKFQWDDGIFSITLGKKNLDGYRTAYFHPLASISEFSVSTKVLKNETNAGRSNHGNDFKNLGIRGEKKQSNMHAYDPYTGIIMYSEIQQSGIGCWNTNKPFSEENHETIQRNDKKMIYPSDLNIDSNGDVWIVTNSMPIFIYSALDPNEYNFRIWTQNVQKLTEGTICEGNKGRISG